MNVFSFIGNIFKPVADLIDDLTLSPEEKARIEADIKTAQIKAQLKMLEYEQKLTENKTQIILAEAKGESWLQRNWRPLLMVIFAGIVIARWFGLTAENIPAVLEEQLMDIIQVGIGGYVFGRSGEKMVKEWRTKK